ncbi:kinase-like protein [Gigaspora margarita]|uniref:Kinase-like protein n=1 Tax=Gigaspora margarita TaxID=4874 RepID=A0A8H3WXD1_GIGMA|nr:kinase-like protein [Gigaspora margarita]
MILGVLFWELTSGIPPFNRFENEVILLKIRDGIRENPIDNTPPDYVQLYKKCWSPEPNDRLTLDEILNQLKLLEEAPVTFITNNVINKQIKSTSDTSSYTKDSNLSNNQNQQEIYAVNAKVSRPAILEITEELRKDFNEITYNKGNSLISHQEEDNLNLDEVLQIIDKQNVLYIKRTSKMD